MGWGQAEDMLMDMGRGQAKDVGWGQAKDMGWGQAKDMGWGQAEDMGWGQANMGWEDITAGFQSVSKTV